MHPTTPHSPRRGWQRYDFREEALTLLDVQCRTAYLDLPRLPELFCGFNVAITCRVRRFSLYSLAGMPHVWSGGGVFVQLQACFELSFSPRAPHIRFHRPRLPDYIDGMHIKNCDSAI